MSRRIVAALGLAAILFTAVPPARAMDAQAVFAKSHGSVVIILAFDSRGKARGLGSGFFVGHGDLVATNNHVVANASSLKVKVGEELLDVIEIKAADEDHDLALLRVSSRGEPLELYTAASPVGADVVVIGAPVGLEKTVSTGIISGIRKTPLRKNGPELFLYQMTAPVSPGSSGGPVLDDQGRVLGLSTLASSGKLQNINFAVPSTYINDLMGKRGSSGIQLNPETSVGIKKDSSGAIHIFSK